MTGVRKRTIGLQVKVVTLLLLFAFVPLAVSALLIEQTASTAQNFASNHVSVLASHVEAAQEAYRQLIDSKKENYQLTLAAAARSLEPRIADDDQPPAPLPEQILDTHPDLLAAALLDADGTVVSEQRRPRPTSEIASFKPWAIRQQVTDRLQLELTFAANEEPVSRLVALGDAMKESRQAIQYQEALPSAYSSAFLRVLGAVLIIVTAAGIFLARAQIRRITQLVQGTRQVADGDLDARVEVSGRDEFTELGHAFNSMLDDLRADRQKILYLQRIGAWQDVARRLAHEIKNPLTPIQLAMQQVVSTYDGDDERFRALLVDCEEIISEEIRNLRRLVDAFSTLGRLPRVEASPIALGDVLGDLLKDPQFVDTLNVSGPADEITVHADRLLLRRLIANLVENGMQAGIAAGRDGTVRVRVSRTEARAVVEVADEGPGVAEADRERIFEPYVTSKETGSGLGLAIAKKIALDHGGALELAPAGADSDGARFVLSLPLARETS